MKKIITKTIILAVILALCVGAVFPAVASNDPTPRIRIDGEFISFPGGQVPVIESGRTLVPLRDVMEPLGFAVEWRDPTVLLTRGDVSIQLDIGSTWLLHQVGANQTPTVVTLDVPARLLNSRTLVPVRAIAEMTGFSVTWDYQGFIVDINTGGGQVQVPPTQPTVAGIPVQQVIATNPDRTQTVRTNTGYEVTVSLGPDLPNREIDWTRDITIQIADFTPGGRGNDFGGSVVNVARVAERDIRSPVIEDLGNFVMPENSVIRLFDLPSGYYYRVTLIYATNGFVWREPQIRQVTTEGVWGYCNITGARSLSRGVGYNELGQPVSINSGFSHHAG